MSKTTPVAKLTIYPSVETINGCKLAKLTVLKNNGLCNFSSLPSEGVDSIDKTKYSHFFDYVKPFIPNAVLPDDFFMYTYKVLDGNLVIYACTDAVCRVAFITMAMKYHPTFSFKMVRHVELRAYKNTEEEIIQTDFQMPDIFGTGEDAGDY